MIHCLFICFRSFFSKYDLQKHESVHSGLKPFECIICQRSFARLTLLRRHEKVHTSVPKLLCTECDMVFLSVKELDAHHKKRHSVEKPFRCVHCPKRFAFKQGLDRHAITHSNQRPYKCHYCPQCKTWHNTQYTTPLRFPGVRFRIWPRSFQKSYFRILIWKRLTACCEVNESTCVSIFILYF